MERKQYLNKYKVIFFTTFSILFLWDSKILTKEPLSGLTFAGVLSLLGIYTIIVLVKSVVLGTFFWVLWYLSMKSQAAKNHEKKDYMHDVSIKRKQNDGNEQEKNKYPSPRINPEAMLEISKKISASAFSRLGSARNSLTAPMECELFALYAVTAAAALIDKGYLSGGATRRLIDLFLKPSADSPSPIVMHALLSPKNLFVEGSLVENAANDVVSLYKKIPLAAEYFVENYEKDPAAAAVRLVESTPLLQQLGLDVPPAMNLPEMVHESVQMARSLMQNKTSA
ncbi:MAG: hypothetical protein RDU13_03220 [Elusimicrobiales bacterium]|nr:hypothetical protein [Elusimicrobiales bacterium]